MKLQARKKKCGTPYEFTLTEKHERVLRYIAQHPGASDWDIAFVLRMHQAGSYRCRLRDAGLVEQQGGNAAEGMTWQATTAGRNLNANLPAVAA